MGLIEQQKGPYDGPNFGTMCLYKAAGQGGRGGKRSHHARVLTTLNEFISQLYLSLQVNSTQITILVYLCVDYHGLRATV